MLGMHSPVWTLVAMLSRASQVPALRQHPRQKCTNFKIHD